MSDPMHDALTVASCPLSENGSDSPKRPAQDGMDGELPGKRMRRSTGSSVVPELGRVAEMVMVLSSMGRMRGGRDPTAVEVEMMKEAREMLAELCDRVSKPRDIASGDVVTRVIEELWLDYQVKDQRLGFKVPKMSIAEKMLLTKRKMEESKKFPSHTTSHTPSLLQASSDPAAENRGTSSVAHVLPLDKVPQNDPRTSIISTGVSDNFHYGRDASQMILPKTDVVQVSADKASIVSFRPSPGFPMVHHQSTQGANAISASSTFAVHNEIVKAILQILTPKIPDTPTWTPPSRDYMNKAVICNICQGTITDVESVLLCDACEKGYHLKCLQSYSQRGIPKAEWHCQKCMTLSHGKPLPPKYGRVMRNMGVSKAPSSAAGVQLQTDRKLRTSDAEVNPVRISSNGANVPQNNNIRDGEAHQNSLSFGRGLDLKHSSDTAVNNQTMTSDSACPGIDTIAGTHSQEDKTVRSRFPEGPTSTLNPQLSVISTQSACIVSDQSLSTDIKPSQPLDKFVAPSEVIDSDNSTVKREDHDSDKFPDSSIAIMADIQQNEQLGNDVKQLVHELENVQWIGEPLDLSNGKIFYNSCCVGGVTYKLGEHALFHSNNEKVTPFKLQSMWEDTVLGLTYVNVSRCYFPGDLPNNICYPFTSDNEVFESNHSSILLAGSIKGPCEVLSPAKYKEESEKLSHWDAEDNERRVPLFLCSWFYDESKGHFQAFSI